MTRRLELEVPPDWQTVKSLWDRSLQHLAGQGLDADAAYALAMVVQELLENGVKYGGFSPGRDRIGLVVSTRPDGVVIEVRTPLTREPDRLHQLETMVQWIRGFQNPFEAFVERLKEISTRPYSSGDSGLGLVRVAYEGQCLIDFYVDEGDVLAMSAVYHLSSRSNPRDHGDSRDLHP